jgi:hypothetical protein
VQFTPTGTCWLNVVERSIRDFTETGILRGGFGVVEM